MTARPGRVLIIDDDELVRGSLRQLLDDAGYTVDVAADGEAGLALIAKNVPDAILVDLMMPGMNGRQFLRTLRADATFARIPVILMTGVTGLTVPPAALGASEVVEKPFEVEELLNKVALAVYRARQARGSDAPPLLGEPFVPPRSGPLRAATPPPFPTATATEPDPSERGVVLVVLRDRAAVQRLDALLSTRGYTVVSLTRVTAQLPRMARALRPRALLLDVVDDAERAIVEQVRAEVGGPMAPLIVITRPHPGSTAGAPAASDGAPPTLTDIDQALLGFLDIIG